VTLVHSWSCASTPVNLYRTSSTGSGRMGWEGPVLYSWLDERWGHAHKGTEACGNQADMRMEFGYRLAGDMQALANIGQGEVTLGLLARRSDGTAESTTSYWKKFAPWSPVLSVDFNSYPNAPDQATTDNKACATGSARPFVGSGTVPATPTLRARVSDPDPGTLLTAYFVGARMNTDGTFPAETAWGNQPSVATGSTAQLTVPTSVNVVDGTYRWRAYTSDGRDTGQASTWCEFTVDSTAPGTPASVTSTDYPADGAYHGGVGLAGSFTFNPPATNPADVAEYIYALGSGSTPSGGTRVAASPTDRKATVSITPLVDGPNTLRVWARDLAGNISNVANPQEYTFRVRVGSGPAAHWLMDESGTTPAADSTGHGNTATLAGGATRTAGRAGVGNALSVNGSSGYAATGGPIATIDAVTSAPKTVRTDANFSAAAWVRLSATGGTTLTCAVCPEGSRTSPFLLGYDGPANRWTFAMAAADTDTTTVVSVRSDAAPTINQWTHVAGAYDATTHTLRLYVAGVAQTTSATLTGGFNATGPVSIGRRRWAGAAAGFFNGAVDDVRIYDRVVAGSEMQEMARPLPPAITFPNGTTYQPGQVVTATLSAGGDINVTSFRYSVGDASLTSVATPPTPGGSVNVTFTPTQSGDLNLFAVSVAAGQQSPIAVGPFRVVQPASLAGTVTYLDTGLPAVGVTVRLAPVGLTSTTAADGTYHFTGLSAGTFTVSASDNATCPNFATTDVEISGPTFADLELAPTATGCGYVPSVVSTPFVAGTTPVSLWGDDMVTRMGLPFPFPYYGQAYTSVWVSTNGFASFIDPQGSHPDDASSLPSAALPNATLYPFWDDVLLLDNESSVRSGLTGTAPNRQFVIEWRNVTLFRTRSDPNVRFSFEILLAENGSITFNYSGLDNNDEKGITASVGIEDLAGTQASQYSYRQASLASDTAIVYTSGSPYVPAPPKYLATGESRSFVPADATVLSLTGDDVLTQVTLPFPITFYRTSYTQAWVSTNGYVTFGADPGPSAPDSSGLLPTTGLPNAAAYPFWDDLVVDGSSSVRTAVIGTAPDRQFVVEWRNVRLFYEPTKRITFEVVFFENGQVVFNYASLDDPDEQGGRAVVGVEDAAGTEAVQWSALQPALSNGNAIVFTPDGS
jgi:Concanavalin A-like lectin/glucanases superfamily